MARRIFQSLSTSLSGKLASSKFNRNASSLLYLQHQSHQNIIQEPRNGSTDFQRCLSKRLPGARMYSSSLQAIPDNAFDQPTSIHSSAIVHPDAKIGEGTMIGPFCTVGPSAKVGNNVQLHAGCHISGDTELGDGCIVQNGAIVGADIPGRTVIGKNNMIGHYTLIGVRCQDLKYKAGDECFLIIGENNDIREYTTIHRSSTPTDQTIIGNNNLIMGSCHIAHDCILGSKNVIANATLCAGHVVIEDHVGIGGGVAIHQYCHLGSFCYVGGGTMVTKDIPRYALAVGNRAELCGLNLEGLRRGGFSDLEVQSLRKTYRKIFLNTHKNAGGFEDRIAELEKNEELMKVSAVSLMVKFIRDSYMKKRRGVSQHRC